jgi:hypothetical protein
MFYDLVDEVTESALRAGRYRRNTPAAARASFRAVATTPGQNVRHIVPQAFHIDTLAVEPLHLQLRARQPMEQPVRVQLCLGDEVLASERLRYARPAEMITLEVEKRLAPRLIGAQAVRVDITPV